MKKTVTLSYGIMPFAAFNNRVFLSKASPTRNIYCGAGSQITQDKFNFIITVNPVRISAI